MGQKTQNNWEDIDGDSKRIKPKEMEIVENRNKRIKLSGDQYFSEDLKVQLLRSTFK